VALPTDATAVSEARRCAHIAVANVVGTLRDRSATFFIFVLPFMIIFFVGLTFGHDEATIGVLNLDGGPESAGLAHELDQHELLAVRAYGNRDDLDGDVRRQQVAAGVIIPAGFDQQLSQDEAAPVDFVVAEGRGYPAEVRAVVTDIVDQHAATARAAVTAARLTGRPLAETTAAAQRLAALDRAPAPVGDELKLGFQYTAPANLVFFMFVNVLGAAFGFAVARQIGTFRRALTTPTRRSTIVAGEMLGRFVVSVFQAGLIIGAGIVLFRVRWGDPLGVLAVVILVAGISSAASILLGLLVRRPEHVLAFAPPIGLVLGMLGGCLWPLSFVSPGLRAVGHVAPHAWAMDGLIALSARGARVTDIVPQLAVLVGFAAALVVACMVQVRRTTVQ
jgi:ABC-2 type transport system permease protein